MNVTNIYIFLTIIRVKNNHQEFSPCSDVHRCDTKYSNRLDPPFSRLSSKLKIHKGEQFKSFNYVPSEASGLSVKRFKSLVIKQ